MDFNIAQHNPKTSVLFNRVKVRWILQIKAVGKMLFGREKQENEERRLLGVTPCLWRRNLHCFIGLHRVLPSWVVWEHWDTLMAWHGNAHPAPEGIQESARGGKALRWESNKTHSRQIHISPDWLRREDTIFCGFIKFYHWCRKSWSVLEVFYARLIPSCIWHCSF